MTRVAPRSSEAVARSRPISSTGPGGDPGEHVGVAVQVLGGGVDDQVGAVLERPAVRSASRPCCRRAAAPRRRGRPRQIAGRSATARFGFETVSTTTSAAPSARLAQRRRGRRCRTGAPSSRAFTHPVRLAVDLLGRDHARARRGQHGRSPRTARPCPRRSTGPPRAPSSSATTARQLVGRRVADPRVEIAAARVGHDVGELGRRLELVDHRAVHRGDHGHAGERRAAARRGWPRWAGAAESFTAAPGRRSTRRWYPGQRTAPPRSTMRTSMPAARAPTPSVPSRVTDVEGSAGCDAEPPEGLKEDARIGLPDAGLAAGHDGVELEPEAGERPAKRVVPVRDDRDRHAGDLEAGEQRSGIRQRRERRSRR